MSTIADEIKRAMPDFSKLRAWSKGAEAQEAVGLDLPSRKKRLLAGGYPQRSIDSVESLYGEGFAKAQELARHVVKPKADAMILLIGDRGRGKTQIATWLANERLKAGHACGKYVKAFDLLGQIKQSWSAKNSDEADILSRYKTTGFLVIDEFQERSESEWDNRTLTNIIDHRYDRRLATLIIANLSTADLPNHVPRSILSRCQETGGVIECEWGSYREKQ